MNILSVAPIAVPGPVPVHRRPCPELAFPSAAERAERSRARCGRRSWSCSSTSCRLTLADGRSRARGRGPLPGVRRARAVLDVVPQRVRGARLDRARAAGRSWTATTRPRASCRSPPTTPPACSRCSAATHRMNVSEEATAVCPRGLCEDPRLDGAVRRAHAVDGLGPRPRLAAHGRARGARGAAAVGVRRPGATSRERAPSVREQPHRRPRAALRRLDPGDLAAAPGRS